MPRMQRILRIIPAALIPPLQEQQAVLWVAREEFSAPGAIRPIRCMRRIRVPTVNLDASQFTKLSARQEWK